MSRPSLAIAGGGPVGLALACACRDFEVTVIAGAPAPEPALPDAFDVRVFALSPGSREFLRAIGAWQLLDVGRIATVRRMEVFGDGNAQMGFGARPGGALAWIVEGNRLAAALEARAASLPHVKVIHGARAVGMVAGAAGAWVETGDARIEASLVVGADGPDSQVRSLAGIAFEERPYAEAAIVANFATQRDPAGVARQWFRPDGVLAWLPLPASHISIVWSTPLAHAEALAELAADALERRVRDAGGTALGDLRLASAVARFPLRAIRVPQPVAPGVALVGDAAHTVHPLAGQGLNLGFQDARTLCEVLAQRTPLERPGDLRVLRRYARARSEDVAAMRFVTHGLDRLFTADAAAVRALRNFGLGLVERQPWAKAALARRAMR